MKTLIKLLANVLRRLPPLRNNADGIELTYRTLFAAPLEASDPKLAEQISKNIDNLKAPVPLRELEGRPVAYFAARVPESSGSWDR